MNKYKVKLAPRAFRDLEDIFAYIALEKLSPENAKGQTDRIKAKLKTLETFPQSHQERMEGRILKAQGYIFVLLSELIYLGNYEMNHEERQLLQ